MHWIGASDVWLTVRLMTRLTVLSACVSRVHRPFSMVNVTVSFRQTDRFNFSNWRGHLYLRHWRSFQERVFGAVRRQSPNEIA